VFEVAARPAILEQEPSVTSTTAPPPTSSPAPPAAPPTGATALPVALDLGGRHAEAVRRWVEGVLGWQPVDHETADLVPAAIRLVDVDGAAAGASAPGLPSALLVGPDDPPALAASTATRWRPDLVLAWPDDRDRLRELVEAVLAVPRASRAVGRVVRVGGAAGGVGTSTVALALAGLSAWSGLRALVAVGPSAPVGAAVAVPAAALSAPDLWQRASPLPGVPRARVVRVVDGQPLPDAAAADLEVAVLDAGVAADVEVLVCRADAAGLDAAHATTAAVVVVVGDGPASLAAVRRACGARRWLTLPHSARVARAGLHRRVPTALPGTWLRALQPLAPTVTARDRPPLRHAGER
jgi:hypothetical protein